MEEWDVVIIVVVGGVVTVWAVVGNTYEVAGRSSRSCREFLEATYSELLSVFLRDVDK